MKWILSYNSLCKSPCITQFTYNTVYSYLPQTGVIRGLDCIIANVGQNDLLHTDNKQGQYRSNRVNIGTAYSGPVYTVLAPFSSVYLVCLLKFCINSCNTYIL